MRMIVNESADWGKENEINISPDNIEVNAFLISFHPILSIKPEQSHVLTLIPLFPL